LLRNRIIISPVKVFLISLGLGLCFCSSMSEGQRWSGMLAPSRAIDWSSAGAGIILPRTTICQTLGVAGQASTYNQSVTAAQVASALQTCANTNEVVYLNPGTYTMTSTLFGGGTATPSKVTLRGAGPSQTILKWSATSNNCNGIDATAFCIYNGDSGSMQYSANVLTVSSGMTQGSTSVVLGAAAAGYSGSVSNLHVGSLIAFNQADRISDNGNWYPCGTHGSTGVCSQQGVANAWNVSGQTPRGQMQIVTVTGITASTITFTPGLYAPNWSGTQTPYATFSSTLPVTGFGLENLQINTQSLGDIQGMVELMWVTNSWVQNVSFINAVALNAASRKHLEVTSDTHISVLNSYFYGSQPSSEGYGVDLMWGTSDSLVQNNISQHEASAWMNETSVGNVFAYNYAVDNFYTGAGTDPNWQQCDMYASHDDGDYYSLYEGNVGICIGLDDIHGSSFGQTLFRNYVNGRDTATLCPGGGTGCGTGSKTQNTEAVQDLAYSRYNNFALNVFGTAGYFTAYKAAATSTTNTYAGSFNAIYQIGWGDQNSTPFTNAIDGSNCPGSGATCVNNDLDVDSSNIYWGNYDTVNAAVETNSSEKASSASTYPGLGSPSILWSSYSSFYLSAKPSWWIFPNGTAATPWPGIGPDVTSGNISGTGGYAYLNPAANCYLNVLGGKTDGSTGVLNFDANTCYYSASAASPNSPSGLTGTAVIQ